jgi:MoaA/NifB/PqqE/SkfB family radical SAM enzyme
MKLEDIGFYTLSEARAESTSASTPLQRCELILTERCNFRCKYCRGIKNPAAKGEASREDALHTVDAWITNGLQNVRFTGGEPTLWPWLTEVVCRCCDGGVEHVALSTNGSASRDYYDQLLDSGANDFSVSLDSGCCAIAEDMAGRDSSWKAVVNNIRHLAARAYVTVGMVFTEDNVDSCIDDVMFVDSLGVSDVRVIPAAQYNKALTRLADLPDSVLAKYPILRYRIGNIRKGRHVRGLSAADSPVCRLALDDMAAAQGWHFPCIIHLREGGDPVGRIGPEMRAERAVWAFSHDSFTDPICRDNCLDVCIDYNNVAERYATTRAYPPSPPTDRPAPPRSEPPPRAS